MSKEDPTIKIPEDFAEQTNANSLKVMADALRHSEGNALIALGSILMAAGRAIAFSNIKLSVAVNLIISQFETMQEKTQSDALDEIKLPDGSTWPKDWN